MKFDKDTAIKHHFWIMLAVALPMALVSILLLMTVVAAEISKNRQTLETKLKQMQGGGEIKNNKWVEEMEKKAAMKKEQEKVVWQKAYEAQKYLFTWPEKIEEDFHFKDGWFAIDIKADTKAKGDAAKDDASHFHGQVLETDRERIKVQGAKETKVFQRTAKITVTIDGKAKQIFTDVQPPMRVTITYVQSKYFNDPLTDSEQTAFGREYHGQVDDIIAQVNPFDVKGDGVVQLRDWVYKQGEPVPENARFFRYVAKDWNTDKDISDEAWIAQEDLWVQREIYHLIRQANDYVSVFKGDGGEDKKTYSFTNPYWQLDLKLAGPRKLAVTITNRTPRRQKLDLNFLVKLQKSKVQPAEKILITGEPLNPGDSHEMAIDIPGPSQAPSGIYGVEQVINWETAAVKRIDHISLAALGNGDCCHSNRTFPEGLKPFKAGPKKADSSAPGPGPADNKSNMTDKFGKGDKKGDGVTPNGLHRDRYVEVTPQARRMPVGISLIVDQEHVDRVLFAFSHSPLRFLTTQVIMNRYPGSLRPKGGKSSGTNTNPKGFPNFSPLGFQRPEGNFGQPASSGTRPGGSGDDQESNVELVIYGYVSLYERYPPRPKAPAGR